jgi:peptidoglycan/xylan/chitin deacetylase (PgdA/CDA1 family)
LPEIVYFNLNFDDFHPQVNPDFGGDPDRGAFRRLRHLLDEFPGLVITLFTVPNWQDQPRRGPRPWYLLKEFLGRPVVRPLTEEPYRLDRHPRWCAVVRDLSSQGRLEVAVHGYTHCNPSRYAHGQEFADADETEALWRLQSAEAIFREAGIPFIKAFRPPGWGVSGGTIQALKTLRYAVFSPFPSRLRISSVGTVEGMLIPPQNYSIVEEPQVALRLAAQRGVVFAKGHMVYRYGWERMENGITDRSWANLRQVLRLLHGNFTVRYMSLMQLAEMAAPPVHAHFGPGTGSPDD